MKEGPSGVPTWRKMRLTRSPPTCRGLTNLRQPMLRRFNRRVQPGFCTSSVNRLRRTAAAPGPVITGAAAAVVRVARSAAGSPASADPETRASGRAEGGRRRRRRRRWWGSAQQLLVAWDLQPDEAGGREQRHAMRVCDRPAGLQHALQAERRAIGHERVLLLVVVRGVEVDPERVHTRQQLRASARQRLRASRVCSQRGCDRLLLQFCADAAGRRCLRTGPQHVKRRCRRCRRRVRLTTARAAGDDPDLDRSHLWQQIRRGSARADSAAVGTPTGARGCAETKENNSWTQRSGSSNHELHARRENHSEH